MGVDFLNCSNPECGADPFPDCGSYFSCECGESFCDTGCGQSKTDDEDRTTCMFCRKENTSDYVLLMFLLKHVSMTREEVLKLYLEQTK